jgi:hypothetical protein
MAVRRGSTIKVTRATKRARARDAERAAQRAARHDPHSDPETPAQARVWDRKCRRYKVAGLCDACAAQAAWGHALGFQNINDPCAECQPLVNALPDAGPRGSKWRKCLIKLEYLSEDEVAEVFA